MKMIHEFKNKSNQLLNRGLNQRGREIYYLLQEQDYFYTTNYLQNYLNGLKEEL